MVTEHISLVQDSFAKVEPGATTAGELFYGCLFELDPSLRPLFKGDIKEQGAKLMKMIGVAVAGLNDLETLLPAVQTLGQCHATYGVKPEHYEVVSEALMWTLENGLGELFTADTKAAWASTYEQLSSIMIEAAES